MVQIKATFKNVVRRFSVPDGVSFEEMGQKLVQIFPELKGVTPDSLSLYYRDNDGDLVVISSDEELHTAEQIGSTDAQDKTLKLLVAVTNTVIPKAEEHNDAEEEEDDVHSLLGLFLSPFHSNHSSLLQPAASPFDSLFSHVGSWSDRRRVLKEQEERLRKRREYEEKMRRAHREHLREMLQERMAANKKAAEEEKKKKEEAAKENKEVEGSTSHPVIPSFPVGWSVDEFGSWKPVVLTTGGPFGSTTRVSWGPWGYTATYKGKDEAASNEDKTTDTTTTQDDTAKPQEDQPAEGKVDA